VPQFVASDFDHPLVFDLKEVVEGVFHFVAVDCELDRRKRSLVLGSWWVSWRSLLLLGWRFDLLMLRLWLALGLRLWFGLWFGLGLGLWLDFGFWLLFDLWLDFRFDLGFDLLLDLSFRLRFDLNFGL